MNNFDHHFFKLQSQLLILDLQLAAEGTPKRSGEFETTYKNEGGKEIVVKRSPDGKFAHKGGSPSNTVITDTAPLDPKVAQENGRVVREILTGKTGDDLKKNLSADFEHRPIIKQAIENVDFAEVTKGDADALTNISKFMSEKFEQALNASSILARETLGAAVSVAGFVARSLMYSAAFGATLILGSAGIGIFQKGVRPDKALIQQMSIIAPAVVKSMFSKESLIHRLRWGAIVEGVFRSLDIASEKLGKMQPPLVEPTAGEAVVEAMRGISGATIKNSLIAGAAYTPGIAEGIKSTNIENVIEGDKDVFSNAVDFMRANVEEASKVISENKKELLIGAAVVGFAVVASLASSILIAAGVRGTLSIVLGLLKGSNLPDALLQGLKAVTPEKIYAVMSQRIYAFATTYKLGVVAHKAITEQIEAVKFARSGGQGAKSFGKKENAVKKLVAEEGLDYEKVLQAITRRKEEQPNPKKAAQIQKDMLRIERDIQEGATKVGVITRDKLALNPIDLIQVLGLVKKETELRNLIVEKRAALDTAEGRGFSLAKRLNELVELGEKQGKESPSYKWRLNVVKAEVQYGEKLDGLEGLGGYGKLSVAMKKQPPAHGSYEYTNYADDKALSKIFQISGSPVLSSLHNQRLVIQNAQKEGVELQKYLATPINAQLGIKGGLTCAFPGGNNKYSYITKAQAEGTKDNLNNLAPKLLVNADFFNNKKIDGYINIGDVAIERAGLKTQGYNALASTKEHTREMMWHESGHLLEVKLGKVEESVAFREDRAQEVPSDRKVIPQQGLSAGAQGYTLGEFYSPYIGLNMTGQGQYANTNRATEVLSSGMELLSSPTLAKRGAKADRETMLYALAAMNEKVKD